MCLRQNKLLLEEKLKTIKDIDDQILELVDDEEQIEKEIDEAGLFRENVRITLLEIEEKLKNLEIEKARNTLDLASKKGENMAITVFGKETSCDIVAVGISGRNSNLNVEINTLVVPTICSPIQGPTIRFAKKMYPHLQNLHLADFPIENETDLNVDVLLGEKSMLPNSESKILGMKWDFEDDQILLNFQHFVNLSRQLPPTKRNLLKLAASVFDPIGFVSPVIVS
eukprot:gene17616-9256_t